MIVFVCENSFEGILTGVYDAWKSGEGHDEIRLEFGEELEQVLFTRYVKAEPSRKKAEQVVQAVREKVSETAYEMIYVASLSQEPERADHIYRFLIEAFRYGRPVTDMLQLPAVHRIFDMRRNVLNENHLLTGFVRFSETREGILFSRIGPKNAVLPLLSPHFADRLSGERWVLYDERHRQISLHVPGKGWVLMEADRKTEEAMEQWETDGMGYEELWGVFHSAIAIKERNNPVCQRTHLPLRYRAYMTEFQNHSG